MATNHRVLAGGGAGVDILAAPFFDESQALAAMALGGHQEDMVAGMAMALGEEEACLIHVLGCWLAERWTGGVAVGAQDGACAGRAR
jgi:hypothetical protein